MKDSSYNSSHKFSHMIAHFEVASSYQCANFPKHKIKASSSLVNDDVIYFSDLYRTNKLMHMTINFVYCKHNVRRDLPLGCACEYAHNF